MMQELKNTSKALYGVKLSRVITEDVKAKVSAFTHSTVLTLTPQ